MRIDILISKKRFLLFSFCVIVCTLFFYVLNKEKPNADNICSMATVCNAEDECERVNICSDTPTDSISRTPNQPIQNGCSIVASSNIQCDVANNKATINWVYSNESTNVSRFNINLNKYPFNDWFNQPDDSSVIVNDVNTSSYQVDIVPSQSYEYTISGVEIDVNQPEEKCNSNNVVFKCEAPRPDFNATSGLADHAWGREFKIETMTSQPINRAMYKFYNLNSLDSEGNPKPICKPAEGGQGYQGACPAGSEELRIYYDFGSDALTNISPTFFYNDIFIDDLNNNNQTVQNIVVRVYFANSNVQTGIYSAYDSDNEITVQNAQSVTLNETCQVFDIPANNDSNSCGNVLRPLIQKRYEADDDIYTVLDNMRGIDPTLPMKFDWTDSVPQGNNDCAAIYNLEVWEVDPATNTRAAQIVDVHRQESYYFLDTSRLDFGKSYEWQVSAYVVQTNMCTTAEPRSEIYHFSTNAFPRYIRSGAAYNTDSITATNSVLGQSINDIASGDTYQCEGNVNCTNLKSDNLTTWGGPNCYSGNPMFIDTQPDPGTRRSPDNPITFWFDYADVDNYINETCQINETAFHRLALVKKGEIQNINPASNSIEESLFELESLAEIFVEFNVSGTDAEKTEEINLSNALVTATRYLDDLNNLRIKYEIEFKDNVETSDYEIFGSLVGSAFDPRGADVLSSILMYDIPAEWDNTDVSNDSQSMEAIQCDNGNTCPGLNCNIPEEPPTNEEVIPQPT